MVIVPVLFWLLAARHAPAWCYVLVSVWAAFIVIKTISDVYDAG